MALGTKQNTSEMITRLWAATLVVAILFLAAFSMQVYFVYEESEIRRESYLANLEQLYQQEVQQCFTAAAAPAEGEAPAAPAPSQECLDETNETGRYAQLLKKWGGTDLLVDGL